MKKDRRCNECGSSYGDEYLCDTCEKDLCIEYLGIPITVEFSYGHELDGSIYHFCNYQCLLKFITQELRKQSKQDDRFIYGEEKE